MRGCPKAAQAAPARDVTGISIDWLFETDLVRLTRWSCLERQPALTRERQQYWHVIGFPHAGAYMLHSDGETALIDAATAAFFNPLGVYRTSHPLGCGDNGFGIVVRPDIAADALGEWTGAEIDPGQARFPFLSGPSSPRSYLLQHRLLAAMRPGARPDPLEMEEGALALVAESVALALERKARRTPIGPRAARRRRESANAVREILCRRFRRPLRLPEIARAVELSEYHVCRIFKAETGLSLSRYLHRIRLRTALPQLPGRRGDFTGLALDLGYSSHSHFSAAFRREFGMTPLEASEGGISAEPRAIE